MFPDATPADVMQADKVAELERELQVRRRVYPRWIQTGKLSRELAHRRIITLEAILNDYRSKGPG